MASKVSLPEGIVVVMLVGMVDVFEVFSDLAFGVPIIGQILILISWFLDIVVLASVQFWFILKGGIGFRKQCVALVGNIVEMIPLLDMLPIRTASVLVAIYLINKDSGQLETSTEKKSESVELENKTI